MRSVPALLKVNALSTGKYRYANQINPLKNRTIAKNIAKIASCHFIDLDNCNHQTFKSSLNNFTKNISTFNQNIPSSRRCLSHSRHHIYKHEPDIPCNTGSQEVTPAFNRSQTNLVIGKVDNKMDNLHTEGIKYRIVPGDRPVVLFTAVRVNDK